MRNLNSIWRRGAAVLLALALLIPMVPVVLADTEEPVRGLTLEELQDKFPHGKYWNGGDPDSWTDTPCTHHGNCPYNGGCGCNSFMGQSIQCMGFAEKLGYDATGFSPRLNQNGWYTYTSSSALNNLKPGDIVRRNGHSMYVIGVNGENVTIADCNSYNRSCNIRWGGVVTKSNLRNNFEHVRSAPTKLTTGYNDLCKRYSSTGTVTVSTETVLYSHPCTTEILESSGAVTTAAPGSRWEVSRLYLNPEGQYWYKTVFEGTVCYLYAGDGVFSGAAGSVSIRDVSAPTNTRYGSSFYIGGVIVSDTLSLSRVGAYIYQGTATETPYMSSEDTLTDKQKYDLYSSAVDSKLYFSRLPVGDYTYTVKAWVENCHADGNTLTKEESEVLLYQSTFAVTSTLPCTHSYGLVPGNDGLLTYVCTQCGFRYTVSAYETDYMEFCQQYISVGTVTVSEETALYTLPCSAGTWKKSAWITAAQPGSQWEVSGLYLNPAGQYWYKTVCDGTVCYLYAGDGVFSGSAGSVSIRDVSAPTNTRHGYSFYIGGVIVSDTLPLSRVGAYIYQGTAAETPYMSSEDTPTGKQYNLKSSTVDSKLYFSRLPVGDYTYTVKAWVENCHANGNALFTESAEIMLYQSTFAVTSTLSCTHSYESQVTRAVTCTEDGLLTYTCTKCDYAYTVTVFASGTHSYGDWETVTPPTCTEPGQAEKACAGCGTVQHKILDATGHTEEAVVTNPTCTQQGYTALYCTDCGAELGKENYVPALGHKEVTDEAIPATCTESGLTAGVHCDVCGEILTAQEIINPLGHREVTDEAIPATCTESGLTAGVHCDVCGEILTAQETVNPLGHSYGDWEITAVPTYTAPGQQSKTCSQCKDVVTQTLPKLENPMTDWNLTLQGDICINFGITLEETDTVSVTVDGKETDCAVRDGTLSVSVAAAQMNDPIAISVNGLPLEKTYTVREYADCVLNGDYDENTKNLVKSMLIYGGAAQIHFGHNCENLADSGITAQPQVPTGELKSNVTGELETITFYGATLVLDAKTSVRIYFAGSTEGLRFTAEDQPVTPHKKGSMYYVEVGDILPQNLAKAVTVTVTDGRESLTVTYSPLDYIIRMYHRETSSDDIKVLVQALYNYYLAAAACTAQ